MSNYKQTFDTPCLDYSDKLKGKLTEAEHSMSGVLEYAMAYINDLEHALSKADAENLDLRDDLSRRTESTEKACAKRDEYRGLLEKAVKSLEYAFDEDPNSILRFTEWEIEAKSLITKAKESLS